MERGKGAGSQPPASHYGRPPLTLRYPRLTLLVTLIVLVALGIFGLNVGDKLKPTSLEIPGSDAAEANQLLEEHFGDSAPFAVLLQGPPKALDRQGPRLIGAMREDPAVTTLSPWDRGRLGRLRPEPNTALIIANFHVDVEEAVRETVPQLNATLEEEIRPPVEYTQTGFATLSRAIQDESIAATHRGELIALPILLIVLMLVFRSPIAAAVPLLCRGLDHAPHLGPHRDLRRQHPDSLDGGRDAGPARLAAGLPGRHGNHGYRAERAGCPAGRAGDPDPARHPGRYVADRGGANRRRPHRYDGRRKRCAAQSGPGRGLHCRLPDPDGRPGDRVEDRPAESRAATPGQPGAARHREARGGDGAGLGRALHHCGGGRGR